MPRGTWIACPAGNRLNVSTNHCSFAFAAGDVQSSSVPAGFGSVVMNSARWCPPHPLQRLKVIDREVRHIILDVVAEPLLFAGLEYLLRCHDVDVVGVRRR